MRDRLKTHSTDDDVWKLLERGGNELNDDDDLPVSSLAYSQTARTTRVVETAIVVDLLVRLRDRGVEIVQRGRVVEEDHPHDGAHDGGLTLAVNHAEEFILWADCCRLLWNSYGLMTSLSHRLHRKNDVDDNHDDLERRRVTQLGTSIQRLVREIFPVRHHGKGRRRGDDSSIVVMERLNCVLCRVMSDLGTTLCLGAFQG